MNTCLVELLTIRACFDHGDSSGALDVLQTVHPVRKIDFQIGRARWSSAPRSYSVVRERRWSSLGSTLYRCQRHQACETKCKFHCSAGRKIREVSLPKVKTFISIIIICFLITKTVVHFNIKFYVSPVTRDILIVKILHFLIFSPKASSTVRRYSSIISRPKKTDHWTLSH